jgi:hypothetical protein
LKTPDRVSRFVERADGILRPLLKATGDYRVDSHDIQASNSSVGITAPAQIFPEVAPLPSAPNDQH